MRLLVVEDDPDIRGPLTESLREAGYAVDEAESAMQGDGLAATYPYDAVLADVRLPEGPDAGFLLVKRLRSRGVTAPVLFLTARDSLDDRVTGLDIGGDDYLVKPFHIEEVHAHVRALLRRRATSNLVPLSRGDLVLDWTKRSVTSGGRRVHLTAKEYGIFELLASHPGRIFTRDEIIDRVWDSGFGAETNIVDVYVKNIRHKVGEQWVQTVRGLGYRFPEESA